MRGQRSTPLSPRPNPRSTTGRTPPRGYATVPDRYQPSPCITAYRAVGSTLRTRRYRHVKLSCFLGCRMAVRCNPKLRGIAWYVVSVAGNPDEAVLADMGRQPVELLGLGAQPCTEPLQLPDDGRHFPRRGRVYFDPHRSLRSPCRLVAYAVVPTRLIRVVGFLSEGRVEIDAACEPLGVGAGHQRAVASLQRLLAGAIRLIHRRWRIRHGIPERSGPPALGGPLLRRSFAQGTVGD